MGSRFTLRPPDDYLLKRDVCSYGYFLLAPNAWSPRRMTFARRLDLPEGVATLALAQPDDRPGAEIRVVADRALSRRERGEASRLLGRMLRFDDDSVQEFHKVDPRWRTSGRGRIFRSPTLFEDVVKTITSCNVTWGGTTRMNERLCAVINPAFPRPEQLAKRRPASLRGRCGVGYRDVRLVELGRMFARGEVTQEWFEAPDRSDEEVYKRLLSLPGVGPYAAANIMQLLGRYSRLALDTEAVKHGREALGMEGSPRQIERRLAAHYETFGRHRFRSYWFELWTRHEALRGPAWTWPGAGREET